MYININFSLNFLHFFGHFCWFLTSSVDPYPKVSFTQKLSSFTSRSFLLNLKDSNRTTKQNISKRNFTYSFQFCKINRNTFFIFFKFCETIKTRRNSDLFREKSGTVNQNPDVSHIAHPCRAETDPHHCHTSSHRIS